MTAAEVLDHTPRRFVAEILIEQGWTAEPSRRHEGFVCLRHPDGPGAAKLIVSLVIGVATLFGGGDTGWKIDFRIDVPDNVVVAACIASGGERAQLAG